MEKIDQTKPRNWRKVLLIASLALNLIFVGLIAGAITRGGPEGRYVGGGGGVRTYVQALPRDQRKILIHNWRASHKEMGWGHGHMRDSNAQILAALRAVPFDPAAVADQFAQQRGAMEGRGAVGHQQLVDIISQMTDEERADFADNVETSSKRRQKHRKTKSE